MLDSGSPRRTMVLRHPQIRVYQPDRASRTACRTATHPADHNPTRYQTQMREILVPHLTNLTPYQHRPVADLCFVAEALAPSDGAEVAKAIVG
jgi:hypothetical protein